MSGHEGSSGRWRPDRHCPVALVHLLSLTTTPGRRAPLVACFLNCSHLLPKPGPSTNLLAPWRPPARGRAPVCQAGETQPLSAARRGPHPIPRAQGGRVPRPYLLSIGIDGIACDPNAVGGAGSVDGYREPADDHDARGGSRLNLHIQGSIGWAWQEEGTRLSDAGTHLEIAA